MLTSFDVAKYFLAQIDEDAGDLISHMKLQKLLYYAQGFHLAVFDEPLFNERIEAWMHGPVVPALYHEYKDYGGRPIPPPDSIDFSVYDKDTRELLDDVYRMYGQFSAWKLRNMTHDEPPWQEAYETASVISHESMKEYFKTQLTHG